VFGRRKQQDEAEAAREAERRALFAELAKRPETVCPFLGLAEARIEYHDGVSDEHRCYAFGDPAELSAEQQQKVCLQRGYGNCPRYLRGVLVIPTEELVALRLPQRLQQQPPVPPPPVEPAPAEEEGDRGSRRPVLAILFGGLLLAGAGVATVLLLSDRDPGVGSATPTPTVAASVLASADPSDGPEPSLEPTPEPTPIIPPSAGAFPTPGPDDEPTGFAVFVDAGQYRVARMDDENNIVEETFAVFDGISAAPVERIERPNGVIYWKTLIGDYTGLAYSRRFGVGFDVYETFETDEGEPRFRKLGEDEL
jgi:hypothetical protein